MRAIETWSLCVLVLVAPTAFGSSNQVAGGSIAAKGSDGAAASVQEWAGRRLSPGEVERLRREKGIEAAAKVVGSYESVARVEKDIIATDLASVVSRSDLIVRGVAIGSTSSVSGDGTWLVTDHQILVKEVFDGPVAPGDIIILRLPGGRVQFADGSIAEIRISEFRGIQVGPEYVLFLARSDGTTPPVSRYELAWGTQGTFELTAKGGVMLLGPAIATVPKSYGHRPSKDLLADTRTAVLFMRNVRERK
jgi:hypothetical protein